MLEFIVKVDEKGRIMIPKGLREAVGISEKTLVKVYVKNGKIIVESKGSVADKFFGCFKVKRWPKNLDEFVSEAVRKWWLKENM